MAIQPTGDFDNAIAPGQPISFKPTVVPPKSLVKKLAEAGSAIGWIEKSGRNNFHNYAYATEADLVSKLRGELFKRNVFIFPSTMDVQRNVITVRSNKNGQVSERETALTNVMVRWTFVDGDSGETMTCDMPGCGEDSGDKGVYKAMTGSEKYLLMKAFLIPTGDDPEKDSDEEKKEGWDRGIDAQKEVAQRKIAEAKPILKLSVIPAADGWSILHGPGLSRVIDAIKLKDANFQKDSMEWRGGEGGFGEWFVRSGKAFILQDIATSVGVQAVISDDSGATQMDARAESFQASNDDIPESMQPLKKLSGFRTYGKVFYFVWGDMPCSGFANQKEVREAIEAGCLNGQPAELIIETKPNPKDESKPYNNLKAILKIGSRDYTLDQGV